MERAREQAEGLEGLRPAIPFPPQGLDGTSPHFEGGKPCLAGFTGAAMYRR